MRAMQASLRTRFGSAAAVAVLAAGGAMATATAASAAGHTHPKPLDATTLSIKNKLIARNHHHAEAISGVLRDERKGVANEKITLDARAGKKRRWTAVGTGTTGADGKVTITVTAPTTKTQYKLVFGGDSTFRKSASNVITLKAVKK
jgi:5-hydroxyisourate hydrolase-like protein (transthyretin family)